MEDRKTNIATPVHIGAILNSALRAFQEKTDGDLARVWGIWDDAVGDLVAQNARPAAFKGRLLYVEVSSSPWMQQLRFQKASIVSKINASLGRNVVEDIKFKIGL